MIMGRHCFLLVLSLFGRAASMIGNIYIDSSNLQLDLRPGLATLGLTSLEQPNLPARLDAMSKAFSPAAQVLAVFDGAAFDGEHAGQSWTCDPEVPDATPLRVVFTDNPRESADDMLVALAQEAGDAAGSSAAEPVSSGAARALLETMTLEEAPPSDDPPPIFAATLLKSAMGKGKRDKREAFLRTCGLLRMGDTVHLPTFLPVQQERSLALVRGIHRIERGVVSIAQIERPAAMVVSDDRGLRRRCFALAHPPVVLGRAQFFNMLDRLMLERAGGS